MPPSAEPGGPAPGLGGAPGRSGRRRAGKDAV